ncbi:MAG: hypothetical protein Q4A11_01150 [Brachymonas sp.]|nr:hypothetical protein [Brachymonas sp.]
MTTPQAAYCSSTVRRGASSKRMVKKQHISRRRCLQRHFSVNASKRFRRQQTCRDISHQLPASALQKYRNQKRKVLIVTAMLTRLLAALLVVLFFGVLAAWAWDRSDANHQATAAIPSHLHTSGAHLGSADSAAP